MEKIGRHSVAGDALIFFAINRSHFVADKLAHQNWNHRDTVLTLQTCSGAEGG